MYFRDLVGLEDLKERITRQIRDRVMPHAQLLVGRDGEGLVTLAIAMARYMNCQAPTEGDSCGKCPSCLMYDRLAHPDLIFIYPIVNKDSKNYAEDLLPEWREFVHSSPYATYQDWLDYSDARSKSSAPSIFVREMDRLTEKLSYVVGEGTTRVVIIYLPEKMPVVMSNKLLKFVEEPPRHTQIIMVSYAERQILGTLRSRMQALYVPPLGELEISTYLSSLSGGSADPKLSAHLSDGNIHEALALYYGNKGFEDELFALYKKILRATVDAQPQAMLQLVEGSAREKGLVKYSREEQLLLIDYLSTMYREAYIYNYGTPEINYIDSEEERVLRYIRGCVNETNIESLLGELQLASRHLRQNVSSKMVFYDLLLRLTSIMRASYVAYKIR